MAEALREASAATGRSQQEIVRSAIANELGLAPDATEMALAVRTGLVRPPTPYRDVEPALALPEGTPSSNELLDRDDR